MSRTIAIAGGGITGMAAAYFLRNRPDLRVVLLEADTRLGGTIRTLKEDGFTVETGPDSFITTKPDGVGLVRELGMEDRLCKPTADRFFIFAGGRLHSLPKGFVSMVPTAIFPFLMSPMFSLRCKLDVLREPFRPRAATTDDESVESFFTRRFGPEMSRMIAEPLFAGIHASTGRDLSINAAMPMFPVMEQKYGSITRAVIAGRRSTDQQGGRKSSLPLFISLAGGMEELVTALAARLDGVEVRTGARLQAIRPRDGGGYSLTLDGGSLDADTVLVTTPAPAAQDLLNALDPRILAGLEPVPSASTVVVTVALRESDIIRPFHATGFVVPRAGPLRMTAATWSSAKWPGRAPAGHVLCRCYYGRYRDEAPASLDDESLKRLVREELNTVVGLRGEPLRIWIHRWPRAMPQYLVGHMSKTQEIQRRLAEHHPGLHLLGSPWRGVGIPDCIRQAREVVQSLTAPAQS